MKNGATRMVMVVDTTAVTWNMVIASGVLAFSCRFPDHHGPRQQQHQELGHPLAQWEDAVDNGVAWLSAP